MSNLREKLLDAALIEVRNKGYSGASIMDILNAAGGKKGSLYHHFSSKKDLIIKMIEERILINIKNEWKALNEKHSDHLNHLIVLLEDTSNRDFVNGCVLGTLLQEICCEDKEFNSILNTTLDAWQGIFILQLQKAQEAEEIKENILIEEVSIFLISILQGALLISKTQCNSNRYKKCVHQMVAYLDTLRK